MLYQLIFSPTGGTAKCARLLAEGMACDTAVIDLTRGSAPEAVEKVSTMLHQVCTVRKDNQLL